VKLSYAIQVVEKRIEADGISTEERAAMRVLVKMGRRILDTRPSLRAVLRAVYGEDLNQSEFDELLKPQS
jgi:hypothetical protein